MTVKCLLKLGGGILILFNCWNNKRFKSAIARCGRRKLEPMTQLEESPSEPSNKRERSNGRLWHWHGNHFTEMDNTIVRSLPMSELKRFYYDVLVRLSVLPSEEQRTRRPNNSGKVEHSINSHLHKPVRIHCPTNKMITGWIDGLWQANLIEMHSLAKYNNGNR